MRVDLLRIADLSFRRVPWPAVLAQTGEATSHSRWMASCLRAPFGVQPSFPRRADGQIFTILLLSQIRDYVYCARLKAMAWTSPPVDLSLGPPWPALCAGFFLPGIRPGAAPACRAAHQGGPGGRLCAWTRKARHPAGRGIAPTERARAPRCRRRVLRAARIASARELDDGRTDAGDAGHGSCKKARIR